MASAAVQNKTPRKVLNRPAILVACSFITPNTIWLLRVCMVLPMVFAIALAFCAWDSRHAIRFVSFELCSDSSPR